MKYVLLPLKQHVGAPCKTIVSAGMHVDRGQLLAVPAGLGANIHASYSGTIAEITADHIAIAADEQQDFTTYVPIPETGTKLEAIAAAGVVGAGGAGFPTAVKLKTEIPEGIFIANASECEPLLAHNIKQVTDHVDQLIRGVKYCMLKTLMGGGTIKPAERKWNPNVKLNNIEIIEKKLGIKIPLEDNEQTLPMSKKRREKYEVGHGRCQPIRFGYQ